MKTILLVDDDEHFQYSVKRACKKVPEIQVLSTANNGQEAIDFLLKSLDSKEKQPDFILLDINMPVMNGFEFLDRYKLLMSERNGALNSIVIAMLTSSVHEDDRKRALASGIVQNYVVKPSDAAETVRIIEKIVSGF